jgi:hypothetical protein
MNFIRKLILKNKDPIKYRDYKHIKKINTINRVEKFDYTLKSEMQFKHSGNCGDIIYSLPTIFALTNNKIHINLHLNQPAIYHKSIKHPLSNVMLNEQTFNMLKPLLLSQPKINSCSIFENQKIDIDLDKIREYPLLLDRGNIARWYSLVFPVGVNLSNPWLFTKSNNDLSETILVARSLRYQSPNINYQFLQKYPKVSFVGIEQEYNEMKKQIPNLNYLPVKDFLELSILIASCKFFIGNQSFPFSIAEGLKVKRLLEICYWCPNVSVEGFHGYDFCFQPQFEFLVEKLYMEP